MMKAIGKELLLQQHFLKSKSFDTLYFGGGTPSLLTEKEFQSLLENIYKNFSLSPQAEITLEANPDDLSKEKLRTLKKFVNRLSIGIQSFDEKVLHQLNRLHTSEQAAACVREAQETGFENISVDLIFSIPGHSTQQVLLDVEKAIALQPQHISVYSLTVEKNTAFGRWAGRGKFQEVEENESAFQFENIIDALEAAGFEQYEISNFAKPQKYSIHNSNYWNESHYLGIGPGAHSFNGELRQSNVANNPAYIKSMAEESIPCEQEMLTRENKINEFIFTRLRTQWGCDMGILKKRLGYDARPAASPLVEKGLILQKGEIIYLTKKGKLMADAVASQMFV